MNFKIIDKFFFFNSVRENLNKYHKYHILVPSIWPLSTAFALLLLVLGILNWFANGSSFVLFFGFCELILAVFFWWRDVSFESGEHTEEVVSGLKIGMALFILSEVMFFFSFFWAFFHVSLVPGFEIGSVWPPVGLAGIIIDPWSVPLLNTFLLLSSGVTVTCAHHAFRSFFLGERFSMILSFSLISKYIDKKYLNILSSFDFFFLL